jgi:DNA invertase Pin-like site-specific DNA recombinase
MSRNVSLNVPEDIVDEVAALIQALSIRKGEKRRRGSSAQKESEQEAGEGKEVCEVTRVLGFRFKKGKCEFHLHFRDGSKTWVPDCMTNCEWLINQCLHQHGITTAYCICRVSTPDQAASHTLSLANQEAELRRHVLGRHQRVKVISLSQSAYKGMPRKLEDIGEAARNGDGIYVYRVDRLSRNIEAVIFWLKDLHERDVEIVSVLDQVAMVDGAPAEGEETSRALSYAEHRLSFIKAIVQAEEESAILGNKQRTAIKRRRERGDEHIGGLPWNKRYRRADGSSGRLELVASEEAQAIITIINRKWDKESATEIANALNTAGYRKRGRKWTAKSVSETHARHPC